MAKCNIKVYQKPIKQTIISSFNNKNNACGKNIFSFKALSMLRLRR